MKPSTLLLRLGYLPAFIILLTIPTLTQAVEYLEEKTVFCYNKQALTDYLHFARYINTDALDDLVIKGECAFIPDGKYLPLDNYKSGAIESVPIIVFNLDGLTLWTAEAFIIVGAPKPSNLNGLTVRIISGDAPGFD